MLFHARAVGSDLDATQFFVFFNVVRKKNALCFCRQNSDRRTVAEQHSEVAVFLTSAQSWLKIIIRLTGKLLTDCVNWLLSSVFRRTLFCFTGRKRDRPSGSFQSLRFIFCGFGCQKEKRFSVLLCTRF